MSTKHERDVVSKEAVVDALLQEQFGAFDHHDLRARIAARFAAGEGVEAAARVEAAGADAEVRAAHRPRPWLVAALLLISVGVVFAVAYGPFARNGPEADPAGDVQDPDALRGETVAELVVEPASMREQVLGLVRTKPGVAFDGDVFRDDLAQLAVQGIMLSDYRTERVNAGVRVVLTVDVQDPVLRVAGIDELRALLPQVADMQIEVLRLPDPNVPFEGDLSGVPVTLTPADQQTLLSMLERDPPRLEKPAGWEWQNALRLILNDGRRIEMAIYPYDRGERLRLGMRGLSGDLSVAPEAAALLREALGTATHVARIAHGVVLGPQDLTGTDAFPASLEELTLFGVGDEDLEHLTRFTNLRRLDCSGIADELTEVGLRHIAECGTIEELSLAGMKLDDDDMMPLTELLKLRRLELRAVRGFTGEGFRWFTVSARWRDGPVEIDLSRVDSLTDAGLEAIAGWKPRELILDGSAEGIGLAGFTELLSNERLERLDLSRWPLDRTRLRALARHPGLRELALDRCGLDDAALHVLATTDAPLRAISIRSNDAVSIAGIRTLMAIDTLLEVDARGIDDLDEKTIAGMALERPDLRILR